MTLDLDDVSRCEENVRLSQLINKIVNIICNTVQLK